jgi:hypothetical protein
MIVCTLPSADGKVLLPDVSIPDSNHIIKDALEYGFCKRGCSLSWPIQSLERQDGFNAAFVNNLHKALSDDLKNITNKDHLRVLAAEEGMAVGCYAADDHTDKDNSELPYRWLVVLQCASGFRFRGFDDNGRFDLEIEASMVIGFNEWEVHSLVASDPESVDVNFPNLFYTIPDPNRCYQIAVDIGLIDQPSSEAA